MSKGDRFFSAAALVLIAAMLTACGVAPKAGTGGSLPAPESAAGQSSSEVESDASQAAPARPAAEGKIYLVPLYDQASMTAMPRYVALDAAGNEVLRGGDMQLLNDLYTGEPYAITVQRGEKTGGTDAYGNEAVQYYSQLYDTGGNLLFDWQPCVYTAAFGRFVISSSQPLMRVTIDEAGIAPEGYHSELLSMDTGEAVLPDVAMLTKQEDGSLIRFDGRGIVTAILDDGLDVVAAPPAGSLYTSLQAVKGRYIAMYLGDAGAMYALLLDETFQPLTEEGTYTYMDAAAEGYVVANASGTGGMTTSCVLSSTDGSVVYRAGAGENITYYDGNNILATYTDSQGNFVYRLLNADGAALADGYGMMGTMPAEGEYATETFYACDGQVLVVLDAGGAELRRMDAGGALTVTWQGGVGAFVLSYYDEDTAGTSWMADAQLNMLVEPGRYSNIYPVWSATTLLNGMQATGGVYSYTLNDVMDLKGNVLVGDLRNVFYADDGRMAVQQGFNVGLMDLHGNWLWKTSAFGTLQD